MAHNNTPIKDVEKSQDDADASTEEMDIDSDSDIDSDIPLTSPLFSFTSRLATTGPSGPPPNIPLPPNSPHTSTTEDKDPNRTTIGQLPTYPSSLSIPLTKPLTLNLRQPTIPGSITVPSIIKSPASTPSPTVLTHQPRIKHQEHNALGIPCPRKGKADKAIPRYLSAAFQKFPFKGGDERLDGQKFEDGAVEPLRLGVKRGSVGGGEGDGGRGGSEVTEQVTHDLDVMLGLSKQKDGLEGYNGQQQPLIIGIASVGGPGAGLEAGPGDSDKKGEGDTSAADDDDIKDEEKSDAAGSAAGEEVLKKKKRRRTRGGGKKAAGTASPGRAPVGTPATPSASGDVGSFISIPVDLLLRPNEGVEPSWDDDEEEEQNRGGKGEGGGKAGSLPPPPPPPPFPPSPPKPTSSSHSAHDSSTLKAKSPFVPAPPAEKRVPPVKLEDRAPTMWSRPQGFEVPRREFDSQRLDRERADLEHLVRGDDERPGESPWGSNSRAAGGGITANDGTDALKSPKRLIDSLPPRKEVSLEFSFCFAIPVMSIS
ncbi:hypothetical protein BKA65DRAFT_549687 [Rhexocercosporidium sp. MPI-PUGE-AT-0058]|nr:hypothetical protein BKA65DRAFT_549687 [Rhexocercosporidium sp. MPI-PUGE-AT-0058]